MDRALLVVSALVLALVGAGCGSRNTEADAGGGVDSGGTDAGTPLDSGHAGHDSGAPRDAGSDRDATASVICSIHCNLVMMACTTTHQQYADMAHCLATCGAFPPGTAEDRTGNSVACRTYAAGNARMGMPETNCPAAGPLGNDVCGSPCEGFCSVALHVCTGERAAYASMTECMTECAAYAPGDYSSASTSGDTLACRMYHATAASVDPATHCGHIGPDSPPCM